MRLSRFFVIFSAMLAAALMAATCAAVAASKQPLTVDAIRTGMSGQGTRIVVEFSKPTNFRAFHMANPYRLVLDVESARWQTAKSALMPRGGLIQGYRSGILDDGLTRIIFDLARPAVMTAAFALPKSGTQKDRVVMDVMPSSVNWFNARLPEVFGNRNLKGAGNAPYSAAGYGDTNDRAMRKVTVPDEDAAITGNVGLASRNKPQVPTAPFPSRKPAARKYIVVIDAGHGGEDPGALGRFGVREKDLTLRFARELERALAETGRYRPVLTRGRDVYIKLRERIAIARRAKADLFISLHADKIDRTGVRGASMYTLSQNASDNETARLADQENNSGVVAGVDLAQESEDVAGILLDLAMREKMNESNLLAKFLRTAFSNKNVQMLPNSHRAAGFAVLKAPDVPSVLIETGFLSNPDEAKLLSTSAFQRRLADAITEGVDAYFRKIQTLQKL